MFMAINPFTLNKIDPVIVRQVEHRVVSGIVHEMKGAEAKKDDNQQNPSFNQQSQQRAAEQFAQFVSTFNLRLEHKIERNKIKIKLKDKKDNLLFESEIDDIEAVLNNVTKFCGNFINTKA